MTEIRPSKTAPEIAAEQLAAILKIATLNEVDRAVLTLRSALPAIYSDIASELIADLLDDASTRSEPYDADRLFRIIVLDEQWPVELASRVYEAARVVLDVKGVI